MAGRGQYPGALDLSLAGWLPSRKEWCCRTTWTSEKGIYALVNWSCWSHISRAEEILEAWRYVKRQTAKMKILPSFLSSLNSRVKTFVFVVNSRRYFPFCMLPRRVCGIVCRLRCEIFSHYVVLKKNLRQRLTVQQDWRELSSYKSTGGNTASTDPGLYLYLRRRSNAAKPVSFGDGKGGSASRAEKQGSHQRQSAGWLYIYGK